MLTKLYAAHENGSTNAGIDIWKHGLSHISFNNINFFVETMDSVANHIYDLYAGKRLAIKLATDAAATILKVDQVSLIFHCFINYLSSDHHGQTSHRRTQTKSSKGTR